ncbi:MAG: hypothetical protein HUK03_06745 [Bacteroidaceae bacterium]|nr:hypothetical protein [Bacteroidaceae bacterium]
MTIRFTLFSQETEDFAIEVVIDADATFEQLHNLILQTCHYVEHPKQCFLVCDEEWHVRQRILLREGTTSSDEDLYLMRRTTLREFIEDEGQHIAYRFDPEGKRHLLLDVTECSFGKPVSAPFVSRQHGVEPDQFLLEEESVTPTPTPATTNEDSEQFYGDDGFEAEELDEEGFEISE